MDCRETRRLLNDGIVPSSYEVQQTLLGFHLATCADCRTYRTKLAYRQYSDLLLLAALLSQQPGLPAQQVASPTKRTPKRSSSRVAQLASAVLAIGALFAMSPSTHAAAPAQTRAAAPAAIQPQDDALAVERQQYSKPVRTVLGSEQALPMTVTQAVPLSAPAQQTGTFYTVVFGDSLWSIAQRYYGDGAQWRAIYDANAGVIGANWNLIYPGTRLAIPGDGGGGGGGTYKGCGGVYTVRPGDSLWSIAQQQYGNPLAWSTIYGANGGTIGMNPNLIYPGMSLGMPCL